MQQVFVPSLPEKKKLRSRASAQAIDARIEMLGQLNDEYLRLAALPVLDTDGMLKLADEYKVIGMVARSIQIHKEAGRMNGTSLFSILCDLLEIPEEKRAEFEDKFWWWADSQQERNDACLEKCIELAKEGKRMPWEEAQIRLL